MKIAASESLLSGKWLLRDGRVVGDETCERIDEVARSHLKKVGHDASGWETLYSDPDDGRLWELTYPQGELHGGGPPQLRCLTLQEAIKKYGDIVPSAMTLSSACDGARSWAGQYNGATIKFAMPRDDGANCVILLDPDASKCSAFENLLCIDRRGIPVWTAKLPTSPDVFLDVTATPEGLLARTWSGLNILLDQKTGAELKRFFVK